MDQAYFDFIGVLKFKFKKVYIGGKEQFGSTATFAVTIPPVDSSSLS
jgi:hypothetical protein